MEAWKSRNSSITHTQFHSWEKIGMNRKAWLIVQTHPGASPSMKEIKSNFLTGSGTLVAFSLDGYYYDKEMARGVAQHMNETNPKLTTHLLEVVETWGGEE